LASTRMKDAPLPLRLCYVQPAYRYEEPQEGRMREFTQAGVELIGAQSLDADAESLFTAFEALDAIGLRDVKCDINHAAIVGGGRYDALLPRFGFNVGAAGWSVSVERLLIALERRNEVRA